MIIDQRFVFKVFTMYFNITLELNNPVFHFIIPSSHLMKSFGLYGSIVPRPTYYTTSYYLDLFWAEEKTTCNFHLKFFRNQIIQILKLVMAS